MSDLSDPPLPSLTVTLRRTLGFIAASGGVATAAAAWLGGGRAALSVAAGVVAASVNLVVLAWIVRSMLEARRLGWVLVATLKMGALFVGVGFLLQRDVVGALPFLVGFGSLVAGITLAELTQRQTPTHPAL
ncbi:MAG: hypothetical protein IT374_07525 [Polyangiaceae bacterium]|nr:hypothetical protein [Polyangiaceae bacterium]